MTYKFSHGQKVVVLSGGEPLFTEVISRSVDQHGEPSYWFRDEKGQPWQESECAIESAEEYEKKNKPKGKIPYGQIPFAP